MKKYFALFLIMAFSLTLFAGYVYARSHAHDHDNDEECEHRSKNKPERHMMRDSLPPVDFAALEKLKDEISLTEEQLESIKSLKESTRKAVESLRVTRREIDTLLRDEMRKEILDKVKIDEIKAQINEINAKLLESRIDTLSNLREILTQEQLEKLDEYREKMLDKGRGERRFKPEHRRHKPDREDRD